MTCDVKTTPVFLIIFFERLVKLSDQKYTLQSTELPIVTLGNLPRQPALTSSTCTGHRFTKQSRMLHALCFVVQCTALTLVSLKSCLLMSKETISKGVGKYLEKIDKSCKLVVLFCVLERKFTAVTTLKNKVT